MLSFGGVGVGRQAFPFEMARVWGHVNFSGGALEVVTMLQQKKGPTYTFKYTWCYLQNLKTGSLGCFMTPHF